MMLNYSFDSDFILLQGYYPHGHQASKLYFCQWSAQGCTILTSPKIFAIYRKIFQVIDLGCAEVIPPGCDHVLSKASKGREERIIAAFHVLLLV